MAVPALGRLRLDCCEAQWINKHALLCNHALAFTLPPKDLFLAHFTPSAPKGCEYSISIGYHSKKTSLFTFSWIFQLITD
jgi:hypothetical protein